jgi:osomolarity two-component system, sensor histidine kinase SLN1
MANTASTRTVVNDTLPPPVLQSSPDASRSSQKKTTAIQRLSVRWQNLKKHMGTTTAPSSSSVHGDRTAQSNSSHHKTLQVTGDNEKVDEIVVDRVWSDGIMSSSAPSEHIASPDKSGGSHRNTTSMDQESLSPPSGLRSSFPLVVVFRCKIWPAVLNFFNSSFSDQAEELRYRQERWFVLKVSTLLSSCQNF